MAAAPAGQRSRSPTATASRTDDPWAIIRPLAPWIIIVIVIRILSYWSARRGPRPWIHNPEILEPRSVDINDESLTLGDAGSSTQWKWDAFDGWSETVNLFLIQLKDKRHLIVPKRALSLQQKEELGRLLSIRAVPPTRGFPVLSTPDNANQSARPWL